VPDAVGSVGFGRVSEQTVQVEVSDDGTGAALRGELDLLAYERVSAELSPLFAAAGDVVVDVSGLSFVDSSGIRLFVRLQRALEERGRLHLRGATPHVASVFEVAGLPELGIAVEPNDG
jgi:anti-sigma B factor antagonist